MAICKPGGELHQEPDHAGTLTLGFQALVLWEINIRCLSHLVHGNLFQQPQLTQTLFEAAFLAMDSMRISLTC